MFHAFQLRHSDQCTLALLFVLAFPLLCWHTAANKQEPLEPKPYQFKINLNTVTQAELQTLPGIGPKIAENIIRYRDQHVPMDNVEELLNVSGIGPKRYSALKPYFVD